MRNSDIETLEKTVFVLIKYLPDTEFALLKEYYSVFAELKTKNEVEKQNYQKKAEYYREKAKLWRKENKERHKAYQKNYNQKKRENKDNET